MLTEAERNINEKWDAVAQCMSGFAKIGLMGYKFSVTIAISANETTRVALTRS